MYRAPASSAPPVAVTWLVLGILLGAMEPAAAQEAVSRRRTLVLSRLAPGRMPSVHLARQVLTVLNFEQEVDPSRTHLEEEESSYEAPGVLGGRVVLTPRGDVQFVRQEGLTVTLRDGTTQRFTLVPAPAEEADAQVDVYPSPMAAGALLASLTQVRGDYGRLQGEYQQARSDLERYAEERDSPEAAVATLLLDDRTVQRVRLTALFDTTENGDIRVRVHSARLLGYTALVLEVLNRHRTESWRPVMVGLADQKTNKPLPFFVRARPELLPPGATGHVAIVLRGPPPSNALQLGINGPEGPAWHMCFSDFHL